MRPAHLIPGLLALLGLAHAGGSSSPTALAPPPLAARPVRELQLAAAPDGSLVLAVIADEGRYSSGRGTFTGRLLTAWRLTGGTWRQLGRVLNYRQPRPLADLNLALDERGTPVLAWNENYGDNNVVEFRAWKGGAWTDWGTRYLGEDVTYAARTRALAARGGEPVLAWGETLRDPPGSRLTVRRWNGQSWGRGPAFNDLRAFSRAPALALDPAGRPTVAWLQGEVLASNVLAARWNGAAWEPLGGPLGRRPNTYVASTRLALDGQGRPVVAWLEDVNGQDTLFASRWTGARWAPLGGAVSSGFASSPSLALDRGGNAVLAWVEERGGVGQVRLARWNGSAWRDLGVFNADARRDARSPSVTVETSGRTVLAWREDVDGVYRVELRRLTP